MDKLFITSQIHRTDIDPQGTLVRFMMVWFEHTYFCRCQLRCQCHFVALKRICNPAEYSTSQIYNKICMNKFDTRKDRCKANACKIQACLKENNYQESACLEVLEQMRLCCLKWHKESWCCSGINLEKSYLPEINKGENINKK